MASIFNALNIGYSGLNASQVGISTTGHNVANADTEGYTRQRMVTAAATPVNISPGERGNGVSITEIIRVFDSFVYDRYTSVSTDKEYSDFTRQTLETLSTYFPEIENVGIKSDLHTYFDLWQSLGDSPENPSIKMALAQQTTTLTNSIQQTREYVQGLQDQVNTQLGAAIDDVNRIGADIAALNKAIDVSESGGMNNANDLRDQRNLLETALSKLVDSTAFGGDIVSRMPVDRNISDSKGQYNINIGGFNFVDGPSFHPIGKTSEFNSAGLYDLYYERQDGVRIPFASSVKGGKIGAILDLRGANLDSITGVPTDGVLQDVLNRLDTFATGLIEATNNLYARSVTQNMQSNVTGVDGNLALVDSDLNMQEGTFDIIVYDVDGNESARRTINVGPSTAMDDGTANSIVGQIQAAFDDNGDNNGTNDIDDLVTISFSANGRLNIDVKSPSAGYTFGIEDGFTNGYDSGTNFAGAIGLNRFFDGDSARNISINADLGRDPTLISAQEVNVPGNNEVALSMVQLQFENINFNKGNTTYTNSIYGYFDTVVTSIGSQTNTAIAMNDNLTAQFSAVEAEYFSISKVSIDEEMTNLIKYQTAYGAAAKIITTIDQMMTTLLGLKQ